MDDLLLFLFIHSLYKASDIWRRTGVRPEIVKNPKNPAEHLFKFPRTPEILTALELHQADEGGVKTFSEIYRMLRAELYFVRGSSSSHGEEL